jgi:hypothetical protein
LIFGLNILPTVIREKVQKLSLGRFWWVRAKTFGLKIHW